MTFGTGSRYTRFGIRRMHLGSCFSANEPAAPHSLYKYEYNAWESNVAKRGAFIGYFGSVGIFDHTERYRTTPGTNDAGFN